jgi:methionine-rich copper-binding protein CopC
MESRIIGVALLAALSFSTLPAWPHAFLEWASPEVGSTVQGSPEAIDLRFNEDLEPAFSTVSVLDQAGNRVNIGNVRVDPANPKQLRVPLHPLAPGVYKVGWRVLSVDTHATQR